jgi:hypothetical protein
MKTYGMWAVAVAGLVVAVAAYGNAPPPPQPPPLPATPRSAQQWEYKVVNGRPSEADFNRLGVDGWELTTSYSETSGLAHHTFRRIKRG